MDCGKLVTIAIPAYKDMFLKEAIMSALNQTYSNIEIVVVNDKSPYDIASVVRFFCDTRIRYYENEENIGGKDLVAQWNRCLTYAKGDYFCLLCDDDVYHPDFVSELMELTIKYPTCHVFRARAAVIDKGGAILKNYPLSPEFETLDNYIWDVCNFRRKQTVSEFLLETQHLRKLGGYYSIPLAWGADYVSIYRLAENGGIASSKKTLAMFRDSGENISSEHVKGFWIKLNALKIKSQATTTIVERNNWHNKDKLLKAINRYLRKQQEVLISRTSYRNVLKLAITECKYNISAKQLLKAFVIKLRQ